MICVCRLFENVNERVNALLIERLLIFKCQLELYRHYVVTGSITGQTLQIVKYGTAARAYHHAGVVSPSYSESFRIDYSMKRITGFLRCTV